MQRGFTVVVLAGMVAGAAVARGGDPAAQAAAGTAGMAWDLVRACGPGNAIVSPSSVWEAIAMAHAGARGATATEMSAALRMPDDRAAIAEAAKALRKRFAEARGKAITLDSANRIWVQQDAKLAPAFSALLEAGFGSGAGVVDFAGAPEPARTAINTWVNDHTAGKIPDLLGPGVISPQTRLVLTNAVYLKAPWQISFSASATRPEPFHLATGETATVPLMHLSTEMVAGRVGEGPRAATVCEIPYVGERLAMVVIVPDEVTGLADVLAGLDGKSLTAWKTDRRLRRQEVDLALPTWKARKRIDVEVRTALESMGMKQAFDAENADFSGMGDALGFFIAAVIHEGFVEVSEEGTEAAAATAAVMAFPAAPGDEGSPPPLEVRADRPFAWAVVDRGTGAILFAGVVADPRGR